MIDYYDELKHIHIPKIRKYRTLFHKAQEKGYIKKPSKIKSPPKPKTRMKDILAESRAIFEKTRSKPDPLSIGTQTAGNNTNTLYKTLRNWPHRRFP